LNYVPPSSKICLSQTILNKKTTKSYFRGFFAQAKRFRIGVQQKFIEEE